jgi:hypothetical protein
MNQQIILRPELIAFIQSKKKPRGQERVKIVSDLTQYLQKLVDQHAAAHNKDWHEVQCKNYFDTKK